MNILSNIKLKALGLISFITKYNYVIEHGCSGTARWVKWRDGTMEVWVSPTEIGGKTLTVDTNIKNNGLADNFASVSKLIAGVPKFSVWFYEVGCSTSPSASLCMAPTCGCGDSGFSFGTQLRCVTQTLTSIKLTAHAIGRWK